MKNKEIIIYIDDKPYVFVYKIDRFVFVTDKDGCIEVLDIDQFNKKVKGVEDGNN